MIRSMHSPSRREGTWLVLLAVVLLSGIVLRVISAAGTHLQFDEPFWMMRGDFMVQNLVEGEFSQLQDRHWSVLSSSQGRTLLRTNIATGTGTAVLTGLGLKMGNRWWSPQGIERVMDQILWARILHAVCSAVTPALLLLLVWRLGLPAFGGLVLALFLLLDPVIRNVGSHAHLEAVLTLTMPASLLLYLLARQRDSMALTALSGVLFGIAFANRVNAVVVLLSLVCFVLFRMILANRSFRFEWAAVRGEGLRLAVFGVCGWITFVALFPPIWQSPVIGFLDTVYQFSRKASSAPGEPRIASWIAAQTMFSWILLGLGCLGLALPSVRRQRLFQVAGLYYLIACAVALLPSPFFARYLSSGLPGLAVAGSCTAALLWRKARPWHGVAWPVAIVVFCAIILSSTVSSAKQAGRTRARLMEFYGELHDRQFGEILVPSLLSVVRRDSARSGAPPLFLATRTNHVQLTYLGAMWSDVRARARVQEGWTHSRYGGGRRCPEGSWQLDNRTRPKRNTVLRLGNLRLWKCDDRRATVGASR